MKIQRMKTFEKRIAADERNDDRFRCELVEKKKRYFSLFKSMATRSFSRRTTTAEGSGTSKSAEKREVKRELPITRKRTSDVR